MNRLTELRSLIYDGRPMAASMLAATDVGRAYLLDHGVMPAVQPMLPSCYGDGKGYSYGDGYGYGCGGGGYGSGYGYGYGFGNGSGFGNGNGDGGCGGDGYGDGYGFGGKQGFDLNIYTGGER